MNVRFWILAVLQVQTLLWHLGCSADSPANRLLHSVGQQPNLQPRDRAEAAGNAAIIRRQTVSVVVPYGGMETNGQSLDDRTVHDDEAMNDDDLAVDEAINVDAGSNAVSTTFTTTAGFRRPPNAKGWAHIHSMMHKSGEKVGRTSFNMSDVVHHRMTTATTTGSQVLRYVWAWAQIPAAEPQASSQSQKDLAAHDEAASTTFIVSTTRSATRVDESPMDVATTPASGVRRYTPITDVITHDETASTTLVASTTQNAARVDKLSHSVATTTAPDAHRFAWGWARIPAESQTVAQSEKTLPNHDETATVSTTPSAKRPRENTPDVATTDVPRSMSDDDVGSKNEEEIHAPTTKMPPARRDRDDSAVDDPDKMHVSNGDIIGNAPPGGNGETVTVPKGYADGSDDDDYGSDEYGDHEVVTGASEIVQESQGRAANGQMQPLDVAVEKNLQQDAVPESDVLRLGEGVGASAYSHSPTGNRETNMEVRRRLQLQDSATVNFLLLLLALTICVSAYSLYKVADDPSPVMFYSDPELFRQRLTCEADDVETFLQCFNAAPQKARLRILGWRPQERGLLMQIACPGFVRRIFQGWPSRRRPRPQRGFFRSDDNPLLFDVSLDLTPFISGDGALRSRNDLIALEKYLQTANPLEVLTLKKEVHWSSWEDVAMNIRQRLRTLGFEGDADIRFEAEEELMIWQNNPWQNFVRSRATQVLIWLSLIGPFFWKPYHWARQQKTEVRSSFQISLDLARYWELLSEGLHATEGFHCN